MNIINISIIEVKRKLKYSRRINRRRVINKFVGEIVNRD